MTYEPIAASPTTGSTVSSIAGARRRRRREETIAEILDLAVEQMAADGVAALSLSTIARRMGIRPPSLYQYFPSRLAVYDALFRSGNEQLLATIAAAVAGIEDPVARLRARAHAMTEWTVRNPVLAQLMFWRPVPGFAPSEAAFSPAVALLDDLRDALRAAVDAGALAPGAATDEGVALSTIWISGIISQQLSNDPDAPPGEGRFTRLVDEALDMYVGRFAPVTT
jgi:AcrR family transcriptional regulator